MAAVGVDPSALPWRRFLNLLAAMWVDSVWDEDDRERLVAELTGPTATAQRSAELQESSVVAFARAAGIHLPPGVG